MGGGEEKARKKNGNRNREEKKNFRLYHEYQFTSNRLEKEQLISSYMTWL